MVGGRGRDVSGEERGGQRKLREQRSQIEKRPHTRREKKGESNKGKRSGQDKVIKRQLCFGSAMVGSRQKFVVFLYRRTDIK